MARPRSSGSNRRTSGRSPEEQRLVINDYLRDGHAPCRLTIINRSGYDTRDIARFCVAGLRATRTRVKDLTIGIVTAPQRSRGCAEIGGERMVLAINAPWYCERNDCLRRLACMFRHECAHLRGIEHRDMDRNLLYSYGPTPDWAKKTRIRYLGRAPNQVGMFG